MSKFIAEHHAEAQEATKLWVMAGRPRQELEYKECTTARYNALSISSVKMS